MKTTRPLAALGAALLLSPVSASAQVAAGTVPNSFDRPAQAQTQPCLLYTSPSPRDS